MSQKNPRIIELDRVSPTVEVEPLPQWARDTLLIVAGGCLAFIYVIAFMLIYFPEV